MTKALMMTVPDSLSCRACSEYTGSFRESETGMVSASSIGMRAPLESAADSVGAAGSGSDSTPETLSPGEVGAASGATAGAAAGCFHFAIDRAVEDSLRVVFVGAGGFATGGFSGRSAAFFVARGSADSAAGTETGDWTGAGSGSDLASGTGGGGGSTRAVSIGVGLLGGGSDAAIERSGMSREKM